MMAAGACAWLVASAAAGQTASPGSGSLGLTSDSVRRGTTQGQDDIEGIGSLE